MPRRPRITICIPHWQVERYIRVCLQAIRRFSAGYELEIIVVDNGSSDASLDYLRSLEGIDLIERPEETHTNWPLNVFTAWDLGLEEATGDYFVTMHSDVFVRREGWLDPLLEQFQNARVAAAGAWKLEIEHPLYAWQKRIIGYGVNRAKVLLGRKRKTRWKEGDYPRDYCAMYDTAVLRANGLTFHPLSHGGGGLSIASQLWSAGYEMGMVPVAEMARNVHHVAHGTAAVQSEKTLEHQRAQQRVERKVERLFAERWIRDLERQAHAGTKAVSESQESSAAIPREPAVNSTNPMDTAADDLAVA